MFQVPGDDARYDMTLNTFKQSFGAWNRSTQTQTTWSFRSHLDENVYSQGIPLLFPHYALPQDDLKTLPATDGQRITLTATGHAGLHARQAHLGRAVVLLRRRHHVDRGEDRRA